MEYIIWMNNLALNVKLEKPGGASEAEMTIGYDFLPSLRSSKWFNSSV